MQEEKGPETVKTNKLSRSNMKLSSRINKIPNKQLNKQPSKQQREKAMIANQITCYNQLSPLWQDFYYQVINKIES